MQIKHFLIAGAALAGAVGLAATTRAATLSSGDLIRASGTETQGAVYYYAGNGKRFVFPNEKTYKTWYPDFSTVKTVTLAELQTLPLGGNVTYKPGAKLVKITTDPKVYAVAANGTLRWVQTEAVAAALYGADWNAKVDDIPDAFFINYKVGSPIASSADYSPSAVGLAAADINTDLKLTTTPCTSCQVTTPTTTPSTPTSTPASPTTPTADELAMVLSQTQAQAGDTVYINASAPTVNDASKIELLFDGQLVQTCVSNYCYGSAQIPLSGAKASYVFEARLTKMTQQVVSKTATVPIQTDGSDKISILANPAQIIPSQLVTVTVDVDTTVAIRRTEIYVDGSVIKNCPTDTRHCAWSGYFGNNTLGSTHPIKAVVTDSIGRTYTSKTLNVTVSDNDTPAVTIAPAKAGIYPGEMLVVTMTASDNDGIASMDILKDGTVLKHCTGAAACSLTTGPWNTLGQQLLFQGRATDPKGAVGTATSSAATVIPQP